MIPVTELRYFADTQPAYRILKPWWDVLTDYLAIVMLMIAVFGGTLQVSQDKMVCLPCVHACECTCTHDASTARECNASSRLGPEQLTASAQHAGPLRAPAEGPTATAASATAASADDDDDDGSNPSPGPGAEADPDSNTIPGAFPTPASGGQPGGPRAGAAPPSAQAVVARPGPQAVKTELDRHQYFYIDAVCYEKQLHWYAKYFPYLVLLHTLLLLVLSNFWFKYPKTSSKIEHFVAILGKCFDSPWTTRALSETVATESSSPHAGNGGGTPRAHTLSPSSMSYQAGGGGGSNFGAMPPGAGFNPKPPLPPPPHSQMSAASAAAAPPPSYRASDDVEARAPMLAHSPTSSVHQRKVAQHGAPGRAHNGTQGHDEAQAQNVNFQNQAMAAAALAASAASVDVLGSLDKKEAEQAKAIFEKVKKLRAHIEESDVIYRSYMSQTLCKSLELVCVLAYSLRCVREINFDVMCSAPDIIHLTGYGTFCCAHPLATLFKILASFYLAVTLFYLLVCLHTVVWMVRRSLRNYSFEHAREESSYSDIPDVRNDFAFLLHLTDQYDRLYAKRFAVFLSEVSEKKLRQFNLDQEWSREKLQAKITRNAQDRTELHLFMLSGLPDAVFELSELQVLKLELIPDVMIPSSVAHLTHLRELWLYHTPARIDMAALAFLRENLRSLHLKFTDVKEIPGWMYSLRSLEELHLTGNLSDEHNKFISLDGLRELRRLRTLRIKSNLSKVPQVIVDVGSQLQKLSINNEGSKLVVLSSLKKMGNLCELELSRCDLERIPHAIFSLTNLQELDLKENNLKTVEEIISFQHLHRLSCLRLWYNQIAYLPIQIGLLSGLERLYLNRNKLQSIPAQLSCCRRLRHLELSRNLLTEIPREIRGLASLQHLALTGNKIEALPLELFECRRLRVLMLGHNALTCLPPGIGALTSLSLLELTGNPLEGLPAELGLCPALRRAGLLVEPELLASLPADVSQHLHAPPGTAYRAGSEPYHGGGNGGGGAAVRGESGGGDGQSDARRGAGGESAAEETERRGGEGEAFDDDGGGRASEAFRGGGDGVSQDKAPASGGGGKGV
ncbi:volume-regulated anion channel subunit LRRC8A-like [Lampetra planeri]